MSNICCMLLVLSLFHRGKNMWSLKFCWPNLSCVSCSGLVCIFLQWLLWVCAEEMSKRKIVCTPGEWIWLLIILFSFFLHINTTQASKKISDFPRKQLCPCQKSSFFPILYPMHEKVQYYGDCFPWLFNTANTVCRGELCWSPKIWLQIFNLWPNSTHVVPCCALHKFNICPPSNCIWCFFLDVVSLQIVMRNLTNQEVATFTYGDWLSKVKNAKGSLVCEMPAMINDEQMMEDTTYTIQVKTSDIGGMSVVDI